MKYAIAILIAMCTSTAYACDYGVQRFYSYGPTLAPVYEPAPVQVFAYPAPVFAQFQAPVYAPIPAYASAPAFYTPSVYSSPLFFPRRTFRSFRGIY